jgi:RNA polymerase sigma factor (TIGR02999 family)
VNGLNSRERGNESNVRDNASLIGKAELRLLGWFCCARRANDRAIVSELTRILEAAQRGELAAAAELLPLVYDELRRLAAHKMSVEAPGHTLQPTALVHEAWLRLVAPEQQAQFQNRAHFFGAAAEAMRRILVDRAREKKALKRGGDWERVELESVEILSPMPDDELLALDEALDRLATVDTRAAEMVKLCFFVGLTQAEAARELGVALSTAERIWAFARAWLLREVRKERGADIH